MLKFLTICLFALLALASAKPHLLTTGISYATPAVAAVGPIAAVATPIAAAVARPIFTPSTPYYPAYTVPYYGYGPYATYPYFGSTYFVRR